MGLQQVLGYRSRPANPVQLAAQRVASARAGSWLFQRTVHRIDRPLYRWTGGRVTVPGLVAGLPAILLTTTGARSGQARISPLVALPLGEDMAVLGTNYAQPRTPGWVFNLEADPRAVVTWKDRTADALARPPGRRRRGRGRVACGFRGLRRVPEVPRAHPRPYGACVRARAGALTPAPARGGRAGHGGHRPPPVAGAAGTGCGPGPALAPVAVADAARLVEL